MKPSSASDPVLAQLDWVRDLCLRLVRDVAAADDLVQEVWLVAQAKLPADVRGTGPTRGWLTNVAKNLVRNRRRSETHRADRERGTAQAAAESAETGTPADNLVARSEVLKLVAEAVLALDEPFQRVMLLRWFEGHAPAEIARMEGLSAGTVHSRLSRGQEKVRAWISERHPGAERDWAIALVPVAAKAMSLESGAAWAAGKSIALAAAALGLMGTAAWMLFAVLTSAPTENIELASAQETLIEVPGVEPAVSLTPRVDAVAVERQGLPSSAPAEPVEATGPDELRVQLLDHLGLPAPGVSLKLVRWQDREKKSIMRTVVPAVTDAEGMLALPRQMLMDRNLEDGLVEAQIAAVDYPKFRLEPAVSEIQLQLPPTGRVELEWVDSSGAPVNLDCSPRLVVPAANSAENLGERNSALSQGTGSNRSFYVEPGLKNLTLQLDSLFERQAPFDGPTRAGEVVKVRCTLRPEILLAKARLVDETGQPLSREFVEWTQVGSRRRIQERTDALGVVHIALDRQDLLEPATFRVSVKGSGSSANAHTDHVIDRDRGEARRDLGDITLKTGSPWWGGTVVDSEGSAIPGAKLRLQAKSSNGHGLSGNLTTRSDESGRFTFPQFFFPSGEERPEDSYRLELSAQMSGYATSSTLVPKTRNMSLQLQLSEEVDVSVRLIAGDLSYLSLSVSAYRSSDSNQRSGSLEWSMDPREEAGGQLFTGTLAPGDWTLRVHGENDLALPLLTLPPLTIETGSDPVVLPDVDLTNSSRKVTLRFENEVGQLLFSQAELDLEDLTSGATGTAMIDNEEELTLPSGPVRIRAVTRDTSGNRLDAIEWTSIESGREVITVPGG